MKKVNYSTTKSELLNVPMPIETKRYKPVSHEQLINVTLGSIMSAGFEVEREWYEASSDRNIATGHYAIKNLADKEMQLSIAWQNSLNKMISLKFALGLHVFLCSNGACSGDMGAFKRKHTGDVQEFTPKTIEDYIQSAGDAFVQMQKQRDVMKEIQLTKRLQAELVGRMYLEEEFIESVQLNIIKRELAVPTYDYGCPNSLWELYQFTTHAMKSTPPANWMKNHIAANSFFVRESGLIIPDKTSVYVEEAVEEVSENQVSMYDVTGFEPTAEQVTKANGPSPIQEDFSEYPPESPVIESPVEEVISETTATVEPKGIEIAHEESVDESTGEVFGVKDKDYSDLY